MITAAPAVPIFSKDPIFHISQKLSPQDKFMPSHNGDSKPPQTEKETITGPEPVLLFVSGCCTFSLVRVFIQNSSFSPRSDRSWLTKVTSWNAREDFQHFCLNEWMMTLCRNTGLRRMGKKSTALSASFSAENCTNSIITYPHTGSLKYNLP